MTDETPVQVRLEAYPTDASQVGVWRTTRDPLPPLGEGKLLLKV